MLFKSIMTEVSSPVAAFFIPKYQLFPKSPSDVPPQQLLPMATTKSSPPCPKATPTQHLQLSGSGFMDDVEYHRAMGSGQGVARDEL